MHVLAFSRTLLRPLVYVHSHICPFLLLVVVGLFGRCLMYLLGCIVYNVDLYSTGCNEYVYNVGIKLIPLKILLRFYLFKNVDSLIVDGKQSKKKNKYIF